MIKCKQPGCSHPHHAKGYCAMHYSRSVRHDFMDAPARKKAKAGEPMQWLEDHKHHVGEACLVWPHSRNSDGRGVTKRNGQSITASRFMCILTHGEPPSPDHDAAHTCHSGHLGCTNPQHLYWATQSENMQDRDKAPKRKKAQEKVSYILANPDLPQKELAKITGLNQSQISRIRNGKTWGWAKT